MVEAKTKDGQIVHCCINDDCEPNEGGYYVEICLDCDLERWDYFCVHPNDCDCSDIGAVEDYVRQYVSNLTVIN